MKARERWHRVGFAKLKRNMRIDSFETDGVGIRLTVKTPIDLNPYIVPVPSHRAAEEAETETAAKSAVKVRKTRSKQKQKQKEPNPDLIAIASSRPVFAGNDEGRAKMYSLAISHDPCSSNVA